MKSYNNNNRRRTFQLFPNLPVELRVYILELAAHTALAGLRKAKVEDYTSHYSYKPIGWYGTQDDGTEVYSSRLLSTYTTTKVYISNKLRRGFKWEGKFNALMGASRLCRDAALKVWLEKVESNDVYKYSAVVSSAEKERARERKALVLRVLKELRGMVGPFD